MDFALVTGSPNGDQEDDRFTHVSSGSQSKGFPNHPHEGLRRWTARACPVRAPFQIPQRPGLSAGGSCAGCLNFELPATSMTLQCKVTRSGRVQTMQNVVATILLIASLAGIAQADNIEEQVDRY